MHYDFYLGLFVYINIGDVRIVRFTRLECIRFFMLHTIKRMFSYGLFCTFSEVISSEVQ